MGVTGGEVPEFGDPRLVAIYDTLNSYEPGTQPDFYAELATHISAHSIVDLGCGTGLVTCELARQGHHVLGVDPAPLMIDIARTRACGNHVRWIVGNAEDIDDADFDLAIMTGHVA